MSNRVSVTLSSLPKGESFFMEKSSVTEFVRDVVCYNGKIMCLSGVDHEIYVQGLPDNEVWISVEQLEKHHLTCTNFDE